MWKTEFSSREQYLFGLLFSRNAKNAPADQSILQTSLMRPKINVSQTFKSSSCKKVSLKYIYHWYECFFVPCDNWKRLSFIQIYRSPEVWYNRHIAAFFETSFWKKSAFYISFLDIKLLLLKGTRMQIWNTDYMLGSI